MTEKKEIRVKGETLIAVLKNIHDEIKKSNILLTQLLSKSNVTTRGNSPTLNSQNIESKVAKQKLDQMSTSKSQIPSSDQSKIQQNDFAKKPVERRLDGATLVEHCSVAGVELPSWLGTDYPNS